MTQLLSSKPWSRTKLTQMLYHGFIGTIADNAIEIGWVLCFSLLADKRMVERITTLFGLNDAFWVVLSAAYYTTRTAMTARLPKLIEQNGLGEESKQFKNHVYLFYLMLLPAALGSLMFLPKLLLIMGVQPSDLPLYIPYFQLTIISILIAAPWSTMIPAYLRIRGRSKEAMTLDHAIAWFMIGGIFITTHIFHLGILWAMVVNIITNAIPLYWFLWKKPIDRFWSKGFEWSWESIKESWTIVKWELVRRLSPRIATVIGASMMITINPIYLAVKYWVANLAMLPEGWVDSMAGLLNSHVSKNVGLKETNPAYDNEFVFWKAFVGLMVTIGAIYLVARFGLTFLPTSIYNGIIQPMIYLCLVVESGTKLRYYMWLSISRAWRQELNGRAQLYYAVPTAILTPTLLWLFLYQFHFGLAGIFLTGAIVGTTQWFPTELYFRKHMKQLS